MAAPEQDRPASRPAFELQGTSQSAISRYLDIQSFAIHIGTMTHMNADTLHEHQVVRAKPDMTSNMLRVGQGPEISRFKAEAPNE